MGDSEGRGLVPVLDGFRLGGGGGTALGTSVMDWLGELFLDAGSEFMPGTEAIDCGFLVGGGGGAGLLVVSSSSAG